MKTLTILFIALTITKATVITELPTGSPRKIETEQVSR